MKHIKEQQGFVALVSALVISGLLIVVGATLGYTGFFSRFNILDGEFKDTSIALAEACAEIARVEIANNASFGVPAQPYNIGSGNPQPQCSIIAVSSAGSNYTVDSQAVYQKSYTTLRVIYNRSGSDVSVTSWNEVP